MTKGMRSYHRKQRRSVRRQNHITRDLRSPISRLRVIDNKKKLIRLVSQKEIYEDQEAE